MGERSGVVMSRLLGIDLGTTGLKAAVFDEEGRQLARASAANQYLDSGSGSAEQDPEAWWDGCGRVVREVLGAASIRKGQIDGIGVCGFHHCPVFLGGNGRPVRPSIVTHDQRLENSLERMRARGTLDRVVELTGSRLTTGHFPVIYAHVLQSEPEAIKSTRWLLLAKDYLRYKLTGGIGTELCDATGTHLIEMPEEDWSGALCDLLSVDRKKLPEIGRSEQTFGVVTQEAANHTGLGQGTPVVFGGGDSHCALVGLGGVESGQIGLLLGTNSTLRIVFKQLRRMAQPPVWIQRHVVPGLYTASASSMAGGAILSWFKDVLLQGSLSGKDETEVFRIIDTQAAAVPAGSEGLLFLPYLFGERSPFCNPRARGAFVSISHRHEIGHLMRSVMEGVAYSTANNLDLLQQLQLAAADGDTPIVVGKSGGGFSSTWRQILADALAMPLDVMSTEEPGCLGAALLAGVGVGLYATITDAVHRVVHREAHIQPCPETARLYRARRQVFNQVYRALEHVLYL
ncbi:MAG: FGGY family carbohydrate kinase [Armatimonadetes bacterium]|nr:FGGY family carbohydrate kinase [Armatimonadota bacterium]